MKSNSNWLHNFEGYQHCKYVVEYSKYSYFYNQNSAQFWIEFLYFLSVIWDFLSRSWRNWAFSSLITIFSCNNIVVCEFGPKHKYCRSNVPAKVLRPWGTYLDCRLCANWPYSIQNVLRKLWMVCFVQRINSLDRRLPWKL